MKRLRETVFSRQVLVRASGFVFAVVVLGWMASAVWCVSKKTVSGAENRKLAELPEISRFFESGYDYAGRFERWFGDHFPRRKKFVRQSSLLRLRGNALVRQGRDGWLYSTVLGAPEVYAHANRFDDAQLERVRRQTRAFGEAAKAAGVRQVYFTFCNDKESLCPEFYPAGYRKVHPESRFEQVWSALSGASGPVRLVRFTDVLRAVKGKTEVFCRSGTHPSDLASYLVYGHLAETIGRDFPTFATVTPEACRFGRDARHTDDDLVRLGDVPLYPDRFLENDYAEVAAPKAKTTLDEKRGTDFQRVVRHTRNVSAGNGLKLFLITDSFGWRWVPYLAESVAELHVVYIGDDNPFDVGAAAAHELLEMKPDVVIVNFTERFLQRLLILEFPKEAR